MVSKTKIELRYKDTDQMGVIHHSNYFVYFELARIDFLKQLGYDYYQFESSGMMFPLRDVQCTYLKSIKVTDVIYIYTSVVSFSKYQIEFSHEVKDESGELKAKGRTKVVSVDTDTFELLKLDKHNPIFYEELAKVAQ
ncbi:MAG: acyl-CoA thioesterase [Candidatus Izemoplasmatales bacterium]